jgi:predicted RNA polymerase sigma factor
VPEIQKVEHLFRHEYGKIVSLLTGRYSSRHIELIEDAVQDALLKAMQIWGYQNLPTTHRPGYAASQTTE